MEMIDLHVGVYIGF